jgi:lipopolysaccharide/colanic/teichoic acid biosynthesis glycosyltransferase
MNHKLPSLSPFKNRMRARLVKLQWRIIQSHHPVLKRFIDVCLVGTAFVFLLPLFLIVAVAIKMYDYGPVLFWQDRVGKDGKLFSFPKFRSMHVNAEEMKAQLTEENQHGANGVTFKMKKDPRITPIGRIIRRTSIDELPQLWCVLKGDMSIVGPRPPVPKEVKQYSLNDRARLSVTPGLTCIWQVSGRSEIPFPQQVEMDIEYIRKPSVVEDVKLIAKTVPAVVKGKGAY